MAPRRGFVLGRIVLPNIRRSLFYVLLVFGLALATSPLWAEGKFAVIEKFANGNTELMVAHYTDPGAPGGKGKVGLLTIATPSRNSFAFNQLEWDRLIELYNKAAKVNSATWTVVGTMTETGTSDVSHLTVSAGPGINFVITSRKDGTVAHTLLKADFSRLQKALREVKDYLSN
jgi:hypothetical protein